MSIFSFLKSTYSEDSNISQRTDKDAVDNNDPESHESQNLEQRNGHETLSSVIAATGNLNTVYKPPFRNSTEEHHSRLAKHAQRLWRYSIMTDLLVMVEGKQYPCHKTVLSCYSTYFRELLLENKEPVDIIVLQSPSITNTAFEVLLTYMYTSDLRLTCQNIGEVHEAARKLGIDNALTLCMEVLSGKTKQDVFSVYVYVTAKKLELDDCATNALRIMTRKFEHIVGTPEFLDMDFYQVREYLSQDVLATRSEVIVFLAALKWLYVEFLNREEYATDVIGCVRFSMMTLKEILACFSPPFLPGILELKKIKESMLEATCFIAASTIGEDKHFERYACKPREYLLKRETTILWNTNIYDPDWHEMYRKDVAATKIQAAWRGYAVRKNIEEQKTAKNTEQSKSSFKSINENDLKNTNIYDLDWHEMHRKDVAATKIQAAWRGYAVRKNIEEQKTTKNTEQSKSSFKNINENDSKDQSVLYPNQHTKEAASATKIQAAFRGYRVRKSLKNDKVFSYMKNNDKPKSSSSCVDETLEVNVRSKSGTDHMVYAVPVIEYAKDHQKVSFASFSEDNKAHKENSKGYILATGGFRTDGEKDDLDGKRILIYNPAENVWNRYGTMKEARSHYCLILFDEEIYFIGGCIPVKTSSGKMIADKNCFKLNLKSREWKELSKMKHSRMYHGVAEVNGKIYVIGGKNNEDRLLKSMEVYDPETDTWEELHESLEKPTMGAGVCAHAAKIWIAGGMVQERDGSPLVKNVKYYDPEKREWSHDVMDLPSPRIFSTVISFENEVYVIGGTSEPDESPKDECFSVLDVLFYKENENRWTVVTNLPSRRHFLSACVIGPNLYVLGGFEHATGECVTEVIMYDKDTRKWLPRASLPNFLCGFNFIMISDFSV